MSLALSGFPTFKAYKKLARLLALERRVGVVEKKGVGYLVASPRLIAFMPYDYSDIIKLIEGMDINTIEPTEIQRVWDKDLRVEVSECWRPVEYTSWIYEDWYTVFGTHKRLFHSPRDDIAVGVDECLINWMDRPLPRLARWHQHVERKNIIQLVACDPSVGALLVVAGEYVDRALPWDLFGGDWR